MARSIKHQEHIVKRNEILDSAQRLVYTKGYQQMTIQDILDDLHISKGGFYHYFDSKPALLEALVERMVMDELMPLLIPIIHDESLAALEKLHRYFDTAASWKLTQKTFMLELLRVWYTDENAIVRQKLFTMSINRVAPLLTEIIRQGIREGVMNPSYPDQAGEMIFTLIQNLGDAFGRMLLSYQTQTDDLRQLEFMATAYNEALERLLGAPDRSIQIIDDATLKEWFLSATNNYADREVAGDGDIGVSE